jgi:hypothetical protein
MVIGYVELDEMWVFTPVTKDTPLRPTQLEHQIEMGRVVEFDPEFLEHYRRVSTEFFRLNGELEVMFREMRANIDK